MSIFVDEDSYKKCKIQHYWGRVEIAPGRGAIPHLHVVAIAKDRAYLQDFFLSFNTGGKSKSA
jgi:hypothetical protein